MGISHHTDKQYISDRNRELVNIKLSYTKMESTVDIVAQCLLAPTDMIKYFQTRIMKDNVERFDVVNI